MVSVIGLPSSTVEELCAKVRELTNEDIQVANFLCDGNYAVSGSKAACDKLCEIAKPDFKARMTVPLSVAGAFHTNFMAPAVPEVSLTQSSLALPCLALPCPALPCPALPCPALPCLALPCLDEDEKYIRATTKLNIILNFFGSLAYPLPDPLKMRTISLNFA